MRMAERDFWALAIQSNLDMMDMMVRDNRVPAEEYERLRQAVDWFYWRIIRAAVEEAMTEEDETYG